MTTTKAWGAAVIIVTLAGCGGDRDTDGATPSSDPEEGSATHVGDTGSLNRPYESEWRLKEEFILGGVSGPEAFGAILAVASDSRGMTYVLDGLNQEIRVFDDTGHYSYRIGGQGLGPGELSGARSLSFTRGDTLVVADDGAGRYSVFAPDGSFIESYPRRVNGFLSTSPLGPVSDGAVLDYALEFPDGRMGARLLLRPLRFWPALRMIDSFPAIQHTAEMLPSGRMPMIYFGDELLTATSREGIWFAHSREYRIYHRELAGDTTLILTLEADAPSIGPAERMYIRERLSHRPRILREYLNGLPERRPVLRRLMTDGEGHVLALADVSESPTEPVLDVFRKDGRHVGRIAIPIKEGLSVPTDEVVHVTGDRLLLVLEDEFQVAHVARFRILRSGR